jgi:hypothetical protein
MTTTFKMENRTSSPPAVRIINVRSDGTLFENLMTTMVVLTVRHAEKDN